MGAGISSIAVEAVGDNISLGMRERGGQVDILNEIGTRAEGYESTDNSNALIDGDIVSSWHYWEFSQPGDTEFTFDFGCPVLGGSGADFGRSGRHRAQQR